MLQGLDCYTSFGHETYVSWHVAEHRFMTNKGSCPALVRVIKESDHANDFVIDDVVDFGWLLMRRFEYDEGDMRRETRLAELTFTRSA